MESEGHGYDYMIMHSKIKNKARKERIQCDEVSA